MKRVFRAQSIVFRSASLLLAATGCAAHAELIYGVAHTGGQNTQNKLFSFDSASPGTVNDLGNITGLGNLQYLADIDFRPSTGELYGLGYTGSVYKIDVNTLVATSIGFVPAPGSGFSGVGIDFDPVTGNLRIIDGQSLMNFSFNPDNNTHTLDSPLVQYVAGDPNLTPTPPFPRVQGIAYDNNVSGALSTTLYGIDVHAPGMPPPATLTTIAPLSGDMTTVGSTGVSTGSVGGFDISGATGNAYTVFNSFLPTTANFYTVDLTTGQATLVDALNVDNQFLVSGISVAPVNLPPGGGNNAPLPAAIFMAPLGVAIAGVTARRMRRERVA
jgi:hypothetical protein